MSSDLETFRKYWNDFVQILTNKIKKNDNRTVTYEWMKLLLKDEACSWTSSRDGNGRWLYEYSQRNPEKGARIREILTRDMCFTQVTQKKSHAQEIKSFTPVISAAAGFGISTILHAAPWVKVVSIVAPAVVGYPAGKAFGEAAQERTSAKWLQDYMEQLNKYKYSVESILSE